MTAIAFSAVDGLNNAKTWKPRFRLTTLLLVMLVFCVIGSTGSYVVKAIQGGTESKAFFIIFTLVAPVALLLVISVIRGIATLVDRFGRK